MLQISVQQSLGELHLAVNTTIAAKGVTAILGRSGAGKSSLINLIAGLSQGASGSIRLNDRILFDSHQNIYLPPEKRRVGYVFQEARLFPHYRVAGNLNYGCKRSDSAKYLQIVALLGIEHLLDRSPAHLSGGEKQRVAIGRALLSDPDILLLDEPLSALDLPRKQELLAYLGKLTRTLHIPILYVTHNLDEVVALADYILLMDNGKMLAHDTTEKVWHSAAFAPWQPLSQKITLLELPIATQLSAYQMLGLRIGSQYLWVPQNSRYQNGDKLRITLASRDISLTLSPPQHSSIRNILNGQICKILPQTDRVDIAVQIDQHKIWASISHWAFDELKFTQGQTVYVQIKSVSL
ncbi:molybdenum ABC transporter ATP-binding protein [[Actinobacillus] muris]|uniref:Molybdenum ABC transporter ATP-binding protein n=2 Tax=Muribacter muris TaxID=67855 RepID=A0A0J5S0X3_9PAST|nr:molybdenum ABC transporter ATP-binding protein ModC [Muribacter muris]KMK50507.1 molybdenum ABC transporter ATP-binding protein [[Actinobacillus] muris] [Muribacter muris]